MVPEEDRQRVQFGKTTLLIKPSTKLRRGWMMCQIETFKSRMVFLFFRYDSRTMIMMSLDFMNAVKKHVRTGAQIGITEFLWKA